MVRTTLNLIMTCTVAFGAGASVSLTSEDILPAMYQALGGASAEIEIVEISRFPAPAGKIEFSLNDLTPPASPSRPTRWRGFVRQEGDRQFSIWAIVRITAECQRVVAMQKLEVGQPILANHVHSETYRGFPFAKGAFVTLADVVGRAPLQTVRAGMPVRPDATVEPITITGGATILAEFRSRRLRITAPVVALGAGRVGETISVRNPTSKKIFGARVDGPGHVVVEIDQ